MKILTFAVVALAAVHAADAFRYHCANGDGGRNYGVRGAFCSCAGYTEYCFGGGNCQSASGSMNCDHLYSVYFSRPVHRGGSYGERSYCQCYIPGCNAGKHGPGGSCTNCLAGKYQSQNQFTGYACHNCPAGQYQSAGGASSCWTCGPGMYQPSGGQHSCAYCPAGQYQGSNGARRCNACKFKATFMKHTVTKFYPETSLASQVSRVA